MTPEQLAVIRQVADSGGTATAAYKALREAGIGGRKQNVLAAYREITGRPINEEKQKSGKLGGKPSHRKKRPSVKRPVDLVAICFTVATPEVNGNELIDIIESHQSEYYAELEGLSVEELRNWIANWREHIRFEEQIEVDGSGTIDGDLMVMVGEATHYDAEDQAIRIQEAASAGGSAIWSYSVRRGAANWRLDISAATAGLMAGLLAALGDKGGAGNGEYLSGKLLEELE